MRGAVAIGQDPTNSDKCAPVECLKQRDLFCEWSTNDHRQQVEEFREMIKAKRNKHVRECRQNINMLQKLMIWHRQHTDTIQICVFLYAYNQVFSLIFSAATLFAIPWRSVLPAQWGRLRTVMPFPGRTDGSEADAFIPSDRSLEHNVQRARLAIRLAYVSVEIVLEKNWTTVLL